MRVDVDETGRDVASAHVNYRRAGRHLVPASDPGDLSAFN
jgi:hypothetical protein